MKVLHVIHSLDLRSGGPSNAIRCLVGEQVRARHLVSLVATDRQSAEPWAPRNQYLRQMLRDPAFQGAEVFLGRALGRRRPWLRYAYSPECKRWLRRKLIRAETRPDLIHIHGGFSHLTSAAAAMARRRGIPYVLRPAGCLDLACYRSGHRRLKQMFSQLHLKKDALGAAVVQATMPAEAEEIHRWLPGVRVKVVPLGAAVPDLDLDHAAEEFFAKFPELRGRRLLLYMSRIAPKKRLELLVEAIAALRAELPDLTLLVAGHDAGHLEAVEAAIRRLHVADRVVFAGFLQGELKHGALAASHLFALPSVDENFGVAVVEAMAHGVPVIVTRGVGTHVFVDKSGCGRTVDGGVPSIAEAVRCLLSGKRQLLGQRGRRFVEEHVSWRAISRQLDDLYQEICKRSVERKRSLAASS